MADFFDRDLTDALVAQLTEADRKEIMLLLSLWMDEVLHEGHRFVDSGEVAAAHYDEVCRMVRHTQDLIARYIAGESTVAAEINEMSEKISAYCDERLYE